MIDSYKRMWINWKDFKNRTNRKDFWQTMLVNFIIIIIVRAIDKSNEKTNITGIYYLISLIPIIAIFVRRLHDANKSGGNLVIVFPIIFASLCIATLYQDFDFKFLGVFVYLIYPATAFGYIYPFGLACLKSVEPNKYGEKIV